MVTSTKFGIVAALEREVRPLLRRCERIRSTPEFAFYEFPDAVIVCGGIGKAAAARAARAVLEAYRPATLVSVGFAGAVNSDLKVGDLLVPAAVLDLESGRNFKVEAGKGVLATAARIAGQKEKLKLNERAVNAVDMEAAAVAEVAQDQGVRFLALKAISDTADFAMPAMEQFVSPAGKFRLAGFLAHVALRPSMWPIVRKLASNAAQAARVLSDALDTLLRDGTIRKSQIGVIVRVDA